jgi:hypothetical protein
VEEVKAAISIGEVSIQLEGPREFVEKYLALYQPIIEKGQIASSLPQEEETKGEAQASTPKRTRIKQPKGAASCMGRVRALISEDYFKEPKTSTEVMNYLREQKGCTYTSGPVTAALNQLIKSGALRRVKESGKGPYRYCNL